MSRRSPKNPRRPDAPPVREAAAPHPARDRSNLVCVLIMLAFTLAVYAPALFGGRVLLPADIVPLMRPWAATAHERFPDHRFAQNQMHGPIFEYYSWRHYARERIRAGEIPLWNPYELGGNVLLANSQSAVLYPPNLLLYVLPLWVGINLVTALHTFVTGCFLFFLLRRYRLGPPAALTGALAWMFCGLQMVWTEFQTPTAVLCWLPAALLAWECAAQKEDWLRGAVVGGGVVALVLLAGHLHFAFYVLLAFVLYGAWRTLTSMGWRKSARPLLALAGAIAFGVMLSAATMVPVFEMGRMNFRGAQDSYAASIGLRLPPRNLLTLAIPNLYGNPRDYVAFANGRPTGGNSYFGAFDFIEYTTYMGVPALLLAFVAVAAVRWRDRSALRSPAVFFVAMGLVGLLLALGTPLCAIFFYGVPGYRQFNATARALCLFSFGVAAQAGIGVDALVQAYETGGLRRVKTAALWGCLMVGALGLAAFPGMALVETTADGTGHEVARLLTDQWFGYELANLAHFGVFLAFGGTAIWFALRGRTRWAVWAIPAVAAADLLIWGHGFNPAANPGMLGYPTQTTDLLKDKSPDRVVSLESPGKGIKSFIVPNYNAVVHLREAQGADSLHTRRYHEMLEAVVRATEPGREFAFTDPNTLHVPNVNHPFFDLMNVRWVTTDSDVQLPPPFRLVANAELTIWENPNAFGPAWIAGDDLIGVDAAATAASIMEQRAGSMRAIARVDKPPTFPWSRSTGTATVTSFAPHRVAYSVDQTGNGLLATSEIYYPGWRPRVDGRDSPLVSVDWILRATPVPAGRHTVVFTYEPDSYRFGLYLSAVAAGIFAWFFTSSYTRRRPT